MTFSNLNGHCNYVKDVPEGKFIFNCLHSNNLNFNNNTCRSAGSFAQLMRRNYFNNSLALLRLRNGNKILIFNKHLCLNGISSNLGHHLKILGKFGGKTKKPRVRGVAKNPVDHPNGGRTPGGKVYRSFSFKIARSQFKTRSLRHKLKLF
jgi:large subunit ribosomal protein L2